MTRSILLLLATMLAALSLAATASAAPLNIEAQAWWRTTPGAAGTDQGHVHMGATVPNEDTITGVLPLDVTLKLHENPGYLKEIIAEASTDPDSSNGAQVVWTGGPAYSCPVDCTFTVPTNWNTAAVTVNGRQEIKYRVVVQEPDGHTMRTSFRFPARLSNGKPLNDKDGTNVLNTYGWYDTAKYQFIRLNSGAPPATVSGIWTIQATFRSDPDSRSTTHYIISADPAFHAVPPSPGVVYYDSNTACVPFSLNCNGPYPGTFQIDTRRLANGPHKLFLRGDAKDPSGSTNSGALVVPFTVAN